MTNPILEIHELFDAHGRDNAHRDDAPPEESHTLVGLIGDEMAESLGLDPEQVGEAVRQRAEAFTAWVQSFLADGTEITSTTLERIARVIYFDGFIAGVKLKEDEHGGD